MPTSDWFVDQYWRTTGDDWAIPDDVMVKFGQVAFAAGVVEGIRQAREAVVWQQQTEPWASAIHYYPSDPLDAIDELTT